MHCDKCERELKLVALKEFDYTERAGLDSKYHQVLLEGISGYECACGIAPVIPNMDGLHFMIGLSFIRDEEPIDGSGIRFMRKTLGMTQKALAEAIEVHEQTISKWERNEQIPERPVRVYAANVYLSHLLQREEIIKSMRMEYIAETIELLVSRNVPKPPSRSRVSVKLDSTPPAWMIAELERTESGANHNTG